MKLRNAGIAAIAFAIVLPVSPRALANNQTPAEALAEPSAPAVVSAAEQTNQSAKFLAALGAAAEPLTPADDSADEIDDEADNEFLDIELEQLRSVTVAPALETTVTTVSRQETTIGRTPAAVFVISNDMIRRSGARTVPDALRLAPGVQVAQIDANIWAITVRGLNSRFTNALLVQIDGRSVYTPVFGGVYWDVQDLLLEDIERIEVIRGPGATVWGANAVNGVINIVTKSSTDTVGVYATAGGGTEHEGFSGARIGGQAAGGDVHWRLWGKWFERDSGFLPDGPTYDQWNQGRIGFRTDVRMTACDALMMQGMLYDGISGDTVGTPGVPASRVPRQDDVDGGHFLSRWTHTLSDDSDWSLQTYYDRADRVSTLGNQKINTFDVDYQYRRPYRRWHNVICGVGYRRIWDEITTQPPSNIDFVPDRRTVHLYSTFVQDDITLIEDRLFLTAGTKLEHNSYTKLEVQPSIRMLLAPDERQAYWGAVSRAVRIPSRAANDVRFNLGGPFFVFGARDLNAEAVVAYEVGYRAQPTQQFNWDLALFYNDYTDLIVINNSLPVASYANAASGRTYGGEVSGNYQMNHCWNLFSSFSYAQVEIDPAANASASASDPEGSTPHYQAFLMSSWDFYRGRHLDVMCRYVDDLPVQGVDSYISMDVRLGWRPSENWEFAVVGQNLLDDSHREFGDESITGILGTEVERSVYGQISWRY